ncbi:MAG: hypothetical protein ACXQS8_05135, partial [Candidatus Helarchaeales archaeon]
FFFFLQNVGSIIITYIHVPFPILNLGIIDFRFYNYYLLFFTLTFLMGLVITYFSSQRVRSWASNKISQKNAFLEFLSLIERDERRKLLVNMADTAREILISGIIDLFEPKTERKSDLGETIKEGIEFVRRFFRGGKEEDV